MVLSTLKKYSLIQQHLLSWLYYLICERNSTLFLNILYLESNQRWGSPFVLAGLANCLAATTSDGLPCEKLIRDVRPTLFLVLNYSPKRPYKSLLNIHTTNIYQVSTMCQTSYPGHTTMNQTDLSPLPQGAYSLMEEEEKHTHRRQGNYRAYWNLTSSMHQK